METAIRCMDVLDQPPTYWHIERHAGRRAQCGGCLGDTWPRAKDVTQRSDDVDCSDRALKPLYDLQGLRLHS
jgi:hypothetical protein